MKKLLILAIASFLAFDSQAQQTTPFTTNIAGISVPFVLLTTRANVKQIVVANSKLSPVTVEFFDNDSLALGTNGTNIILPAYVSRSYYSTNIASSFVGVNGVTNWYTNSGVFTYNVTNAASTNTLAAAWTGAVGASQAQVFNTDFLCVRGVVVRADTNCVVTFYYNSGQ